MSNIKILLTGATGFIGSQLANRLVKEGREVHAIIRPGADTRRIKDILPFLKCHAVDLSEFEKLKEVIYKIKPKGIFHLAASTVMSGVTAPADKVVKSNLLGTVNLINATINLNYKFFVNTGSFLEYDARGRAVKESDPCLPLELYSITKHAAVLYGQAIARTADKPILALRLFTPYGPQIQKGRLIYNIIKSALEDKDINLTNPKVARDFIFVDDIINLYLEVAKKAGDYKGEIFNAGTGQKVTLNELVKCVLDITKSKSKVNWNALPLVVYDTENWQADMSKTFSRFSWRPQYTLREGLIKTINWFKLK